jgi:hypothetical protein
MTFTCTHVHVNLVKWLRLEIGNKEVKGLIPCKNFMYMVYGLIYNIKHCILYTALYMAIYIIYGFVYYIWSCILYLAPYFIIGIVYIVFGTIYIIFGPLYNTFNQNFSLEPNVQNNRF